MFNPNNPLSIQTNYTAYLANPDDKKAFLAGCRAMIDIYGTSSPDELAFLSHSKDEERLISLLLAQQRYNLKTRHQDAANIIQSGKPNRASLRAMVFGIYLNDAGYAIDENGYVVEDGGFQLIPGKQYCPWPYTLARDKQTGVEITREEYDALTPEQQESYDVLRYLDIKNDGGILLKRITSDNEVYMAELIASDLKDAASNPIVYRYLSECGAGHGNLPQGRFYDYRKTIANAAQKLGIITEMMAKQISAGYVNSLGQLYLGWLQSLAVTLTSSRLCGMSAYQLAALKLLLTTNQDDLAYSVTDDDIVFYRNVNGDGMKGAIVPDEDDQDFMNWLRIPASDGRCDLSAQINYICNVLIPKVGDIIVQTFLRASDDAVADMEHPAMIELIALIESIEPDFFKDDEPDAECIGCEGCDGDPSVRNKTADGEEPKDGEEPAEQE